MTASPGPVLSVETASRSDIGLVREENQDSILVRRPDDEKVLSARGALLAVADGMGGLRGGQLASRMAVEALERHYFGSPGDAATVLARAVETASRQIYDHSVHRGGEAMGSTDYKDLEKTPDKVKETLAMAASNAAHLARLLGRETYPGVE